MTKSICLLSVLALALATFTTGRAESASRCLPKKRFVVLSGGLVSDTLTNLVWQQQASATTMNWAAAKTYCSSGFRLPTAKELTSLMDLTVTDSEPTIDQSAFPGTPAEYYWTSSPYAGASGYAWIASFLNGTLYRDSVALLYRVRCVR